MKKVFENVTITFVTERESMLDSFTAKVDLLTAGEFLLTEKIPQKYSPLPRLYEGETMSLTRGRDGKISVNVKKFLPSDAPKFLSRLYEELKSALEALKDVENDGLTNSK